MRSFKKIFCIIVIFNLAACQAPRSYTPELSPEEIRAEQINQQRMVDEINAKGGQPKSWRNHKNMRAQFEDVGENIERAGAEICVELHLQKRGCYYYFKLTRDEDINSHADGKNIVIYTGMMRFIKSDDELAAVMAHEFAHNLMGHVQAQEKNATFGMLLGLAADALADSQGINTASEMTKAGKEIGVLTYSADFEKEADYVGLYVMARAGYAISKAPLLWRRMSLEDPDGIYISTTHPSNSARFVALQKAIYEVEYKRKHNLPILPELKN